MTFRWLILRHYHITILSSSSSKNIASSFRIKTSDLHHLHSTCLKSGGICSGFLSAAGNRAELMGLMPCVPCASCLSSFWNTAGYLRSLPAVALGQGLVQRCGCKQSAITHTTVMLWSHRFMCKTESELSLLTPPIPPPASSSATVQSENGVSRKGLRIWQSPARFPSSCLEHDEPPLAHKENSISGLGAQDGCTCDRACREASTSARCKPAIICRDGPWQWKRIQSAEKRTGMPNKRRNLNHV